MLFDNKNIIKFNVMMSKVDNNATLKKTIPKQTVLEMSLKFMS